MCIYVTVFGGGHKDTSTKEYKDSIVIGNILASNQFIVKNGGYYGIMEAVSKGASEMNGYVIGHTCNSFKYKSGNKYLSETNPGENIYHRLQLLIENTDIFIFQKGGIGTLSELFLTLDIVRKLDKKPTIILFGEFWKDVINSVSHLFNEGEGEIFKIVSSIDEIKILLDNEKI